MEPPLKRPRLSIFANEAPSVELDTARLQNDRHLKGRFEAIFQKYERDFAGVGDEVDLSTGEVVVNNGHLAGLIEQADTRSEADEYKGDEPPTPGSNVSPRRRRLVTNGRSMLRAMTVAPDCDDAYFQHENADDVMDSIETIAENAALSEEDDASSGRSDDDLEDEDSEAEEDDAHEVQAEDRRRQSNQPIPIPVLQESPTHEPQPVAVDSDDDSLFEVPMERESSPDSLFEQPTEKSSTTPYEDVDPRQFFDSMGELDSEAIVARYGDKVGQEVLELIQRRDKAELHIEAAWRIPVQIEEQESTRDASVAMPDPERSATAISRASSTPKKGASLWTAPKRSRLELHQDRTMTVIRAESEDPLQEGFVDSGPVEVRVAEVSLDRAVRLLNRGMCPYCKEQFFSLPRAQGHLRAILEKTNRDSQNDPHNLARIEELLSAMDEEVEEDHEGATEESNNAVDAKAAGILQSVENKRPDRNRPSKSVKGAEESDDDLFMDAADTDDNYDGLPWAEEDSPTLHTSSFPIPEQLTAPTPSAVTRIMVEDSDEADHEPEARPQPGRGGFIRQQHRTSSHHDASLKASVRRSPESPDVARHENGSDSHHNHNSLPEAEPSRLPLRPRKAKKVIKYCFKNKQSGKLRLSVPKRKQRPPARPPACPLPRSPARSPVHSPVHSPDCPPSTETPYKCAVCPKRYRNPNGLHYHKLHAPSCYPDLQVNNDQPAPSVIPAPSSGIVIAISTKRPDASIADSPSAIGTGSADNGNDRAIGGSTKTRHR